MIEKISKAVQEMIKEERDYKNHCESMRGIGDYPVYTPIYNMDVLRTLEEVIKRVENRQPCCNCKQMKLPIELVNFGDDKSICEDCNDLFTSCDVCFEITHRDKIVLNIGTDELVCEKCFYKRDGGT